MAIPANARTIERVRATASGHFALGSRIPSCGTRDMNHNIESNATGEAAINAARKTGVKRWFEGTLEDL
jgi:hypothetical protein